MRRDPRSAIAPARSQRHLVTRLMTNHRLGRRVDPAWLTVSQLCRRWQLGRKTIYKFIDAEILPVWKVSGRLYRVAIADVLRFEAQNKLPPQ
jgi:excisionase family DNA binding protein